MEGSFADAANNHWFKRARWRRLRRQQVQDYLIATAQNVRILLRDRPNHRTAGGQTGETGEERAFCAARMPYLVLTASRGTLHAVWSLN